ncbi:MAG: hypothetical protein JSR45_00705 [Proteobacteria bacterium]|nr:hypothetical protein [Pseudomonadota bacterium]
MEIAPLPLGRNFQLWEFCVSHKTLYWRSNKQDGVCHTRVNLLFKVVERISLPTVFDCETLFVRQLAKGGFRFSLNSEDSPDFVDALVAYWLEDKLEYNEPVDVFSDQRHGWRLIAGNREG